MNNDDTSPAMPDVTSTKPSTMRTITPLLGTSQMFIVQTYRQRDALTGKVRSKIGKANAAARKERGELPGFMKRGKHA